MTDVADALDRDRASLSLALVDAAANHWKVNAADCVAERGVVRHLPSGQLSRGFAWGFILFWSVVFSFASSQLNALCFVLAPIALAVLMFYSYTKRFTSLSHIVLGFSLGIGTLLLGIAFFTGAFQYLPRSGSWMEKVKTSDSSAKMAAVPFPWWTSQSIIAMRCIHRSRWRARMAMAMSLKTQKPEPSA